MIGAPFIITLLGALGLVCLVAGAALIRDAGPWVDTPLVAGACRRDVRRGRRLMALGAGLIAAAAVCLWRAL